MGNGKGLLFDSYLSAGYDIDSWTQVNLDRNTGCGYGFHGPFEHISVEGMETAVNIIKSIVKHVLMLADA